MTSLQKANAECLWWYLLSLGFQPDVAVSIGTNKTNMRHISLGINMFDKPNKEAFYIVTHFLFGKLHSSRVQDAFRYCWPVLNPKADAEFRKVTLGWLQEIAAEVGNTFPRIFASNLQSPGGPKFINLMLHLAKHVMLQDMKTFHTDGTWVPEAAAVPASSLEMEAKRFQMVKKRFQRAAVEQDSVIQEYQRRAKGLEKSLRQLRGEEAKYDDLLKQHERDADQEERLLAEKVQKVRSLWATIDSALSSLEGEQKVLESVVQGQVDQYTLNGSDVSIKMPKVLLERMERLSHLSSMGNLYEAGQPVLLRLLELLNEALGLLNEERSQAVGPTTQSLHLQALQEKVLHLNRSRETIRLLRCRLTQEDIPRAQRSVRRLEADWERKWAECLRNTPLTSFLGEEPVLDFLSPMAPLSFEPASDTSFKTSIFSQYPARLLKLPEQTPKRVVLSVEEEPSVDLASLCSADLEKRDPLLTSCQASSRLLTPEPPSGPTPVGTPVSDAPILPTPRPIQSHQSKNIQPKLISEECKRARILDLEFDNLASQFADAVTTSPAEGSRRGMELELEQLLGTLSNPFMTRKQLTRTPESLLMEVRSSWRKAVEEGVAERTSLSGRFVDSFSLPLTPVLEAGDDQPSQMVALSSRPREAAVRSPPLTQQGLSSHSTLTWDSSHLDALNSQSSGDIIQFSIAEEPFPDHLGSDSLLTNSDTSMVSPVEVEGSEDEELVLPEVLPRSPDAELALKASNRRRADILGEASFTGSYLERSPEALAHRDSGRSEWNDGEKLFSLDLDQLEGSSPHRELTLPNLMSFSPIDDI